MQLFLFGYLSRSHLLKLLVFMELVFFFGSEALELQACASGVPTLSQHHRGVRIPPFQIACILIP